MLIDIEYDEFSDGGDYVFNLQLIMNRCVYTPDKIDRVNLGVHLPTKMSDTSVHIPYESLKYISERDDMFSSHVGRDTITTKPQVSGSLSHCLLRIF